MKKILAARGRVLTLTVALVGVAALVAGLTTANAAPPRKWVWTETYAERTLMKNLRVPCKLVRQSPKTSCDVAAAQARVDSWNASVAACSNSISCLQFLATTGHVIQTLENVKNGFKLESAECIGSGTAIRFPLFRCQISVLDRALNTNQPRTVSGRIAVTTTGKTTFRWALI